MNGIVEKTYSPLPRYLSMIEMTDIIKGHPDIFWKKNLTND